MRVRTENKRWKVLEILCQRKCLVGRATLVLRLCRVKDHRERVVLKSIWRDESRKDEGDNVESFEDCHGICKCLWPKQCESTSVANKASLVPSPYMSSFPPPPLSEATVAHLHSETSGTSSQRLRSLAAKQGAARRDQRRCTPPEDRVRSLILMDEGIPLWRVKRLVHLLKVLRDALVGLAGIVRRGRVHRDISEGNILCDPIDHSIEPDADPSSGIDPKPFINLRSLSTQKTPIDPESEPVLMPNADTRSDSDSESTLVDSDESEDETLVGDDDESEALFGSHLPFEGGKIRSTTYEEYTQKRYKTFGCIGRLYDLEFMVEENRDNNMARHQNRTGTPAFIAAQLLLATNDKPIRHTFLHDLESFFWVLVWALATHVQPGKRMNKDALRLIDSLCSDNDWALGNFKRGFILTPRTTRQAIKELGNGWEDGRRVVQKFAESLKTHIYDKEGGPGGSDDDVEADAASEQEPWLIVKTVIDIFDEQILGLQELGE
ncbi:hypothetical protein BDV93DRAFT_67488 [Ceratobasidium sp. AG-I]|nr:hypothetical protein BDV93DRAFT_67488 [Ceratobasidium sp. AG-I]